MKNLIVLLTVALLTPNAFAAFAHHGEPVAEVPSVLVTKGDAADGRKCEIKTVIMHTKGNLHANDVGNRVIIELRKPRGSYLECPASVAMNVESRADVMRLYELVKGAKKVVCQSSTVVSGSHINMTCDGSFEIRSE